MSFPENHNLWLPNLKLPEPMSGIRGIKFQTNSFAIIAAGASDNCYFWNSNAQQFVQIHSINWPTDIKDGDNYNNHYVVDVTKDDKNNNHISNHNTDICEQVLRIRDYVMFGVRYDRSAQIFKYILFDCKHNLNTNTLRVENKASLIKVTETQPTFIGDLGTRCVLLKKQGKIIGSGGSHSKSIVIFDVKTKTTHVHEDILPVSCSMFGFVLVDEQQKQENVSEFLIWGNVTCYQMLMRGKQQRNRHYVSEIVSQNSNPFTVTYTFTFVALDWIDDTFVDWYNFAYATVYTNEWLIICGGIKDNPSGDERMAEYGVHLYDLRHLRWMPNTGIVVPGNEISAGRMCAQIEYMQHTTKQLILHLMGGIALTDSVTEENSLMDINECDNHWRLDLGYHKLARKQIWMDMCANHRFSVGIWKIMFALLDDGFLAPFTPPPFD